MSAGPPPHDDVPRLSGKRALSASIGALAVGTGAWTIGLVLDPRRALASYLVAYAFVASVAVGALVLLMIVHAMGATWPLVVRRLTEGIAATMPVIALLFLPIALGLRHVYPWAGAHAHDEHAAHLLAHRGAWASSPAFLARSALYLGVWVLFAELAFRRSIAADREPLREDHHRFRALGAVALPPIGLSLTFAAFDWLMSLEPTAASTMFGVYFFAGGFLGAIASVALLAHVARARGMLPWIAPSHDYALGRLLLAFVVFWAYTAYFQFFITWIADRPEEVPWYVARTTGSWGTASVVLFVAQAALPLVALLSHALKWRSIAVAAIAAWLLVAHWLDVHWLVLPSTHPGAFRCGWTDVAAMVAVGGAVVAFGVARLRGHPLAPIGEPALELAARYSP